jgi:hypothetical protein
MTAKSFAGVAGIVPGGKLTTLPCNDSAFWRHDGDIILDFPLEGIRPRPQVSYLVGTDYVETCGERANCRSQNPVPAPPGVTTRTQLNRLSVRASLSDTASFSSFSLLAGGVTTSSDYSRSSPRLRQMSEPAVDADSSYRQHGRGSPTVDQ